MNNPRLWPWLIGAATLAALLGAAGLSVVLAWELRAGLEQGVPFRAALCMGCTMIGALGGAVGLLVVLTRRFIDGRGPQRVVLVSGLALLMGLAPLVIIMVVYLLVSGRGP
ncbi:MAG: hypothetical protein RMK84_04810 [Oscillochloridaceae bacterium]|nr:hypothetical protein [Chloroflexaceae bacterium]MDW8389425.1 hypothetical protein [Oscillochloridaceae bacterium]